MSDYHERIYHYDPKEIRKQIENSTLFSINIETERTIYEREAYKLIENLVKYLFAINESENVNFGVEIAELASRCIKAFDSSAGTPFLAYFMASWKNEYKVLKGKECQEQNLVGMHINNKLMSKIAKYVRLAKDGGIDYTTDDYIQIISDALDRRTEEIKEYIILINSGNCLQIVKNNEGEENDILDEYKSKNIDIDENIISIENLIESINDIEKIFASLQNRQKKILSEIITFKLLDSTETDDLIIDNIRTREFFSLDVYERFERNERITIRNIAQANNVSEQSASRSYRIFTDKIKIVMEERQHGIK